VIAGYRLEERIGRGGMGVVFRASDERLGRQVAVKILAPALGADRAFRHRFVRESRAAAMVDDPHIIPIFQAGESGRLLFIAMRLVSGGDVRTLVRQHGSLPAARTAAIVSPVACALDAAHAAGLVHRDVKPANMLLDVRPGRPDHVYLSDFGLSKGLLSSPGLTGEGMFVGTPHYVAPEQITGGPVDGRADQYSLACAAFELLSGAPPFPGDNPMAVIHAQAFDHVPSLSSLRPAIPSAVDAVLAKALAKTPAERYPTCQDFAESLRAALGLPPYGYEPPAPADEHRPGTVAEPPAADPDRAETDKTKRNEHGTGIAAEGAARRRAVGRHRKRRWWLAAVAIVVASLLAGAGAAAAALLSRHTNSSEPPQVTTVRAEGLTSVPGSLQAMLAVSARSTWALGDGCAPTCALGPGASSPVIAHWNGTTWSKIIIPTAHARLMAAVAGPAGTVWFAGSACVEGCGGKSKVFHTLILRWDGHHLSPVASPSPGLSATLASVTTGPAGTAYAVGYYCVSACRSQSEIDRTLVLSWDHGRWTQLRSKSPGVTARLTSVSVGPTGLRWAVGYYCAVDCGTPHWANHTLTMRPGGRAGWLSVPAPSPGDGAQLNSVSVGADGTAWAVGGTTHPGWPT
jgi:hypothetical protein